MGSYSDFTENAVLNYQFHNTAYTSPSATLYIALATSAITDADTGTSLTAKEPVGNGYARTLCNTWTTATTGTLNNSADVVFPAATGPWGTVTEFAVCDAATNGNIVGHGTLTTPQTITSPNVSRFVAGNLVVSLD